MTNRLGKLAQGIICELITINLLPQHLDESKQKPKIKVKTVFIQLPQVGKCYEENE